MRLKHLDLMHAILLAGFAVLSYPRRPKLMLMSMKPD